MSKTSEILENELTKLVDLMTKIALKDYSPQAYGAKRLKPISESISSVCRCISDLKYFENNDK
jgi:hypothetical protein